MPTVSATPPAELAPAGVRAPATDVLDPGPVHLNLAFREPLSGELRPGSSPGRPADVPVSGRHRGSTALPWATASRPRARPGTVVIAGHGAGPVAEQLARAGGWPLLAEVSSGARFGRNLVAAYRELLPEAEFGEAGRARRRLRAPDPQPRGPAAAPAADGVETIVVAPAGAEVYNPGRRADPHRRPRVVRRGGAARIAPGSEPGCVGSRDGWSTPRRSAPDLEAAHSTTPAERLASVRAELDAVRAPVDPPSSLVDAVWRPPGRTTGWCSARRG